MKLKRAYSPGEVLNMKIPRYEFTGDWQASQKRRLDYLGCQRERKEQLCDAVGQVPVRFRTRDLGQSGRKHRPFVSDEPETA